MQPQGDWWGGFPAIGDNFVFRKKLAAASSQGYWGRIKRFEQISKEVRNKIDITNKQLSDAASVNRSVLDFVPQNADEEAEAIRLCTILYLPVVRKKTGRPGIPVEDHDRMREEARRLKNSGEERNVTLWRFVERYDRKPKYIRRILENKTLNDSGSSSLTTPGADAPFQKAGR